MTRLLAFFFVLFAAAAWVEPASAACSLGKDCARQVNKPWCYTTGLNCAQQPSGSVCPHYGNQDGFYLRAQQLQWVADSQVTCPGRTTPTCVGVPLEAEESYGESAGGGPSTRTQEWSIWYTSDGNPNWFIYNSVGIRGSYCPAGYSQAWGGVCQRVRVDCRSNPPTCHPVLPFAQEKRLSAVDLTGTDGLTLNRHYSSQSAHRSRENRGQSQ